MYLFQSLLVSITVATAAVFSLVGGMLNDYLGRKPTTLIASLLFLVGSIELAGTFLSWAMYCDLLRLSRLIQFEKPKDKEMF